MRQKGTQVKMFRGTSNFLAILPCPTFLYRQIDQSEWIAISILCWKAKKFNEAIHLTSTVTSPEHFRSRHTRRWTCCKVTIQSCHGIHPCSTMGQTPSHNIRLCDHNYCHVQVHSTCFQLHDWLNACSHNVGTLSQTLTEHMFTGLWESSLPNLSLL